MMAGWTQLTDVESVHERRSWVFTVRDEYGALEEGILVPCHDDDGIEAWVNRCTHEEQRLDRGMGAVIRDGEIVCPRHGSMFDTCTGYCDNGEAAETTLVSIDVAVRNGTVYLTDDDVSYVHAGSIDDDDGTPSSSSHLSF